jgi:hypothetical protein
MPKKTKLPKAYYPSEHIEAKALMQWIAMLTPKHPELDLLFAIPNGGARNVIVAKKLKAEGVKAGIPDYFLPVPKWLAHSLYVDNKTMDHPLYFEDHANDSYTIIPGLFLELKRQCGVPSDVSKAQKEKMRLFEEQGYKCVVAFGADDAIKKILDYLGVEDG